MNAKQPKQSVALKGNTTDTEARGTHRTYDRMFIPQTWNTFQRMRLHGNNSVLTRQQQNIRVAVVRETPVSKESPQDSSLTRNVSGRHLQNVAQLKPVRHSEKNGRWARSWANQRAQQAMLTRNASGERSKSLTTLTEERSVKTQPRSISVRSRNIELDAKAAELFGRLRSIYLNDEERGRRLEGIRERISEFQKKSIRKEVNKRIQEYNTRLKEDERNRKELRRVREKFIETKKTRLRNMHMSRNALEVPAVSRMAYGLPQEGKEFSVPFSSKKTTDEIKKMWRTAMVRQSCIDSFLQKVSQRQQDLPDVTVKTPPRMASSTRSQVSSTFREHTSISGKEKPKELMLKDSNHRSKNQLSSLVQLQSGILESFESLSSDEDDDN